MLFTFSSWDAKKTKPSYIVEKKQWERFLWREKSLLFSCRKTCAATPHRSPSPSEKSFLRGRRSCYLRPRVALPTAVSSTNGGRKSITCSYLCSDSLSVTYFRTSVGVFFLYFQIPDNKTFMELRVKSSEVRVKWKIWISCKSALTLSAIPIDGVCNTVERFSSHAGVLRRLHCSALCPQGDGKQSVEERKWGAETSCWSGKTSEKRPAKQFFSFIPSRRLIHWLI